METQIEYVELLFFFVSFSFSYSFISFIFYILLFRLSASLIYHCVEFSFLLNSLFIYSLIFY